MNAVFSQTSKGIFVLIYSLVCVCMLGGAHTHKSTVSQMNFGIWLVKQGKVQRVHKALPTKGPKLMLQNFILHPDSSVRGIFMRLGSTYLSTFPGACLKGRGNFKIFPSLGSKLSDTRTGLAGLSGVSFLWNHSPPGNDTGYEWLPSVKIMWKRQTYYRI